MVSRYNFVREVCSVDLIANPVQLGGAGHIVAVDETMVVVVVSGMQLLQLRSIIRRHHPPQRAILSQICCFGEREVVLSQILLDGAEPRNAGTT